MIDLVGFLGTSVGGAVFGLVKNWADESRAEKRAKENQRHIEIMALSDNLKTYHESISKEPNKPSSFGITLEWVIWLFAITVCFCIAYSFVYPNTIIYTTNPDQEAIKFGFLGIFNFEHKPTRIIEISSGGVGYRLIYAIVFILSSVVTGNMSKKAM